MAIDVSADTQFSIEVDKFRLPYAEIDYPGSLRINDPQGAGYLSGQVTIKPAAKKFQKFNLLVLPETTADTLAVSVDFDYTVNGNRDQCAYDLGATSGSLKLTNALVQGLTILNNEETNLVVAGACPRKGEAKKIVITGIENSKATDTTQLTFAVWDTINLDGQLIWAKSQESEPVTINNKFEGVTSTLDTNGALYYGVANPFKLTWTSKSVYPANSQIHLRVTEQIKDIKNLACQVNNNPITCSNEGNGLIKIQNPFTAETAVGTQIEVKVSTIQLPYCAQGDIDLYLTVKYADGHDLDITTQKIQESALQIQTIQISNLKLASDGFVFNDVVGEYNSLKFIFDHAAGVPSGGYLGVVAPDGVTIDPNDTTCASAQTAKNGRCVVSNKEGEKGVTVYIDEQSEAGTAEIHFYGFQNPATFQTGLNGENNNQYIVGLVANDSKCQERAFAFGSTSFDLLTEPSSTLIRNYSFNPANTILGAENQVGILWTSENAYPDDALGGFYHKKAMEVGAQIECLSANPNAQCEIHNDYIIKASNILTEPKPAGTELSLLIKNLQNPYCGLESDQELKFSLKDALGHDIDRIEIILKKDAFTKDVFRYEEISGVTRLIGEKNTIKIEFYRVAAIQPGSCLVITLPPTMSWEDRESTCTPVFGLDGGVSERVRGGDKITLKICGLTGTRAGESAIELANFKNPTNPGTAEIKLSLTTQKDCEYGHVLIPFEVSDEDGNPGPRPSGERGKGSTALSLFSVAVISLLSLFSLMMN